MFVVESGLVRIERIASNGRRVLIELAAEGQMIGELSVLDEAPRSATAVTLESSLLLVIGKAAFLDAYERDPELSLFVARRLIRRMRSLTDQLIQASGRSATGRIAGRLRELVDRLPDPSKPDPIHLSLPISQEELGQWAGLSREGTAKALRELRDKRVITTGRNKITVLDQAALRKIALRND